MFCIFIYNLFKKNEMVGACVVYGGTGEVRTGIWYET